MPHTDVTQMPFSKLYPLLVNKAVKKGRTREEVDQVTAWLTGYTSEDVYKRQGLGRAGIRRSPGSSTGGEAEHCKEHAE